MYETNAITEAEKRVFAAELHEILDSSLRFAEIYPSRVGYYDGVMTGLIGRLKDFEKELIKQTNRRYMPWLS